MNFFRKFKDYVLGEVSRYITSSQTALIQGMLQLYIATQDLKEPSEASFEARSSSKDSVGFVQKVALKQTVQPVLQNPGYGASGGVQVSGTIISTTLCCHLNALGLQLWSSMQS